MLLRIMASIKLDFIKNLDVSLGEIAILATAFIILFPERIINALKEKSHKYYYFVMSGILIFIILL